MTTPATPPAAGAAKPSAGSKKLAAAKTPATTPKTLGPPAAKTPPQNLAPGTTINIGVPGAAAAAPPEPPPTVHPQSQVKQEKAPPSVAKVVLVTVAALLFFFVVLALFGFGTWMYFGDHTAKKIQLDKPVQQEVAPIDPSVQNRIEMLERELAASKSASTMKAEKDEESPGASNAPSDSQSSSPPAKAIRYVEKGQARPDNLPPPPIAGWKPHGSFLVPFRQMPDGKAGYGATYARPPKDGASPPQWALPIVQSGNGWARNERGDWAIPIRN